MAERAAKPSDEEARSTHANMQRVCGEFGGALTVAAAAKLRETSWEPLGTGELRKVLAEIINGAVPARLETDQLDFKRHPDSKDYAINRHATMITSSLS